MSHETGVTDAKGDSPGVEKFPGGGESEPDTLAGNRIEKGGDARFGSRPHHFRHNVGIEEPRQRFGRAFEVGTRPKGR